MGTVKEIAVVRGDGSAPEMMEVACKIAYEAAKKDEVEIVWVEAPMGWATYGTHGDTYPESSRETARRLGVVFFGGVGDPELEKTIGKEHRKMSPERRALLGLRKDLGVLVNVRPLVIPHSLAPLARVRPENIPECGVRQVWMRYLQEDGYLGTQDLLPRILGIHVAGVADDVASRVARAIVDLFGIKLKEDVTGEEPILTELAYFTLPLIVRFAEYAFRYAESQGMSAINVHKANILARSSYWKKVIDAYHERAYPNVNLRDFYIDAAMSMVYEPAAFNAVIMAGNEHGDIGSDGALGAFSMGMMCSSAVNPLTNAAMFESGAGTCPELVKNTANPLGRILTAAMMLRHIGATKGADAIEHAVDRTLAEGWRTADLSLGVQDTQKILGTREMGLQILSSL